MVHKYTQGLIIDGITYNIPMVSIQRTLDFLEKYAERTEDGDIKIESIGLYKNYTISIDWYRNLNDGNVLNYIKDDALLGLYNATKYLD